MSRKKNSSRKWQVEKLEDRIVFSNTYFVDPVNGSDDRDGLTAGTAVRSAERFVSQYESLKPANHVELAPGDTIVLMPGEHHLAYRYGEGQWQGLFLRGVHGTADQPITIRGMEGAHVDNRAPDGTEMSSIYVLQSSHIVIENLDVSSYGSAITVADATDVAVRNNYIHDVDGIAANNLSGIHLNGVHNVVVENNLLTDNYDRSRPGNQNNRHIVIFGGVDVKILGNTMRNSDPNAGMAVDFKHLGGLSADDVGSYEVAYNTIINAAGTAIGTCAPNSYIHHNLLIDSGSIRVADFGGTNQLANERIEYNTIVNKAEHYNGGGLSYFPNEYPGYPLGDLFWTHNLVVDHSAYDHSEKSTIMIDRYGGDLFYNRVIVGGLFHSDGNVYQTQNAAKFDLYGAGGSYGQLGGDWTFAQWQNAGYDRNGLTSSIDVDENYRPGDTSARGAGIYAGQTSRLTLLVDRFDIDESGEQGSTKLRVVRSGNTTESLHVTLTASKSGELRFAREVNIPAGEDWVEIEIEGISDLTLDPTQAIQIEAQAAGLQAASTWLRLQDSLPTSDPMDPTTPMDPKDPCLPVDPSTPGNTQLVPGVFQVPGKAGESVWLETQVTYRGGEYNNAMGIAYVDDAMGRVNGLLPSDPGWMNVLVARSQHTTVLQSGVTSGDSGKVQMTSGRYFVFFLVQDSTLDNWQSTNATNDLSRNTQLFSSIQSSNPDHFDHVHETTSPESIDLAWEDLDFGGDQNFTDLVVKCVLAQGETGDPSLIDATHELIDIDTVEPPLKFVFALPRPDFEPPIAICGLDTEDLGESPSETPDEAVTYLADPTTEDEEDVADEPVDEPVDQDGFAKQWTNREDPNDVNADGFVTPLDLLIIIDAMGQYGSMALTDFPADSAYGLYMIDTNSDGNLGYDDGFEVFRELISQF